MKKTYTYVLLLCIFSCSLFFSACDDNTTKTKSVKTEATENSNNNDSYVNLKFDDGNSINLVSPEQSGGRSLPSRFHASLSGNGITVMLQLRTTDGPIKEAEYRDIKFGITVKDLSGEEYQSLYYNENETGKRGEAEITITSVEGDNVNGSFSGTLYSKTGKRTTVNGKFSTDNSNNYGMNSKLHRSIHESWAYSGSAPLRDALKPEY